MVVTLLILSSLVSAPQQAPAPGVAVTGVVLHQTGAVLSGATVDLAAGGRTCDRWRPTPSAHFTSRGSHRGATSCGHVGIISSPLYGTPVAAGAARQFQLSIRYKAWQTARLTGEES